MVHGNPEVDKKNDKDRTRLPEALPTPGSPRPGGFLMPSNIKTQETLKKLSQPKKTKQTAFNDSITGVYPQRTHGFGVYSGARKVWSVRVDETLLKQAKPVLKAKFGSECRGVESWLAGLVATTKGNQLTGVYPSNTVEIGKLVIERNIRSRRRLVEEETEVTETVGCAWCHRRAVAVFRNVDSDRSAYACDFHKGFLQQQPSWQFVEVVK